MFPTAFTFLKQTTAQANDPFDILKKRIKKLERQLNNNKIFLNMVIHDMRNPTNAIDFALKEVLMLLEIECSKTGSRKPNSNKNCY